MAAMIGKTPLSKSAKPYTPKSEMFSSCYVSNSFEMATWVPVSCWNTCPTAAAAKGYAPHMLHSIQDMPRGCTSPKQLAPRLSSRSSSPSGSSMSHSEVSTTAESLPMQTSSSGSDCSEVTPCSDLNDVEIQDFFVKNTFVDVASGAKTEQPKLFRNSSAPSIMQSCPFKTNMMERHDSGTCRPCAYFYDKSGCHAASSCKFCHFCSPNELEGALNKRKDLIKERLKQNRLAFKARKKATLANQAATDRSIPGLA